MKRHLLLILLTINFISFAQERVVADLKVQGNKKLNTNFIHKIAQVKAGIPLDILQLEEDIIRLKRLP